MKKLIYLLIVLSSLSLMSCNKKNPSTSSNTEESEEEVSISIPEGAEKTQTVTFYIDYWHSENSFFEMKWYPNVPMGECPEECRLTSEDATDPLFTTFLGWSQYSSAVDETNIWNFKKDSKLGNSLVLYGIWIGEE